MTSTIRVSEKKVNGRQVVAFRKEYADEEHEVFAPKEQATQIMLDLLATVNDSKDSEDDQFVLVRKSELGYIHE